MLITGAEESPDIPNLLARVLLNGVHSLFRRGLDREYLDVEEEIATVRGRIDVGESLSLRSRNLRKNYCSYDELSHDVLHNQILKAALKRLCLSGHLHPGLAKDCRSMMLKLHDVSNIKVTSDSFSRVRLHRNNAFYDFLLRIARLIFACLMPNQDGTEFKFVDMLRDEREMAHVFEAFVRNFYKIEQKEYRVEPLGIPWDATVVNAGETDRLPNMRVDVFLRSDARQIIIDTKYYAEALQTYHGAKSFRSGHLYQLFTYLKNHAARLSVDTRLDGKLLYPQVGGAIDAAYEIQGHNIQLSTIDLTQPWPIIQERLLNLVA